MYLNFQFFLSIIKSFVYYIMGSSTSTLSLDDEIKNIKMQLQSLQDLDKNNDGVITKNEFIMWETEQKNKMTQLETQIVSQLTTKYNKILSEKDAQITEAQTKILELTKQLASLKDINRGLEEKLADENPSAESEKKKLQKLSKDKINEFVKKLLVDQTVNINYLPDFVEKQIYKNVFSLLIGLLNNTLSTTSIKFLGHELTFMIKPEQTIAGEKSRSINPDANPFDSLVDINTDVD